MAKSTILSNVKTFINQRATLNVRDFSDSQEHKKYFYQIQQDKLYALKLIKFIELADYITADMLMAAKSGGCKINPDYSINFVPGQWSDLEFRRSALNLLNDALWSYARNLPAFKNRQCIINWYNQNGLDYIVDYLSLNEKWN